MSIDPVKGIIYGADPDRSPVVPDIQRRLDTLERSGRAANPTGAIIAQPYSTAPTGYLGPLAGPAVSRADYPGLHSLAQADGYPHGAGDGSTTFNLPDGRGRNLIGVGTHPDIDSLTDTDGLAVGDRTPRQSFSGTTGGPNSTTVEVFGTGTAKSIPDTVHGHSFSGSTNGGGRLPVHFFIKV